MSHTDSDTIVRQTIKTPSMWKVTLHNDDFTPMDFVVLVLMQIFNKNVEEASALMQAVHVSGVANVGLYTKEVASTKVLLTMRAATKYGHPLLAVAEEA